MLCVLHTKPVFLPIDKFLLFVSPYCESGSSLFRSSKRALVSIDRAAVSANADTLVLSVAHAHPRVGQPLHSPRCTHSALFCGDVPVLLLQERTPWLSGKKKKYTAVPPDD